ncbi:unannotated protein [freshwater metagenome]|uniref:Unannotated protein n=1 Tax=freshwater metagenome TaxID=449393 RepID=A0A6J6JIX5_9ZZZZ
MHDDRFAIAFLRSGGRNLDDLFCLVFQNGCTFALHFVNIWMRTANRHVVVAVGVIVIPSKKNARKRSCCFFFATSFRPYQEIRMHRIHHAVLQMVDRTVLPKY